MAPLREENNWNPTSHQCVHIACQAFLSAPNSSRKEFVYFTESNINNKNCPVFTSREVNKERK